MFCVFDKDTHSNYTQALNELQSATPKKTYAAINSVPCFEYWLLLHYTYTTRPYTGSLGNSSCNQVIAELLRYLPEYEKGMKGVFETLFGQIEQAKQYAIRAIQESERNGTDNPGTRVHELVNFLQNLKKSK